MLKNYKLKLFAAVIVFGVSIGNATAFNSNTSLTTIASNSTDWVEVQNENGIKVYFSQYEQFDGVSGLKIKFENQTSEKISFSWTLTNDAKTITHENVGEVAANQSIEIMDEKNPISYSVGETMNDFHINLNIQ